MVTLRIRFTSIAVRTAVAGILISLPHTLFAQNWKHFSDSQFPAYVQEIDFPGGTVLNPNRTIAVGSWTVSFQSSSLPIMVNTNHFNYTIYGLTARNAIMGEHPAHIYYIDGATFGNQKKGIHDYQWNLGVLESFFDFAHNSYISADNHPNVISNGIISLPAPLTIKLKQN